LLTKIDVKSNLMKEIQKQLGGSYYISGRDNRC